MFRTLLAIGAFAVIVCAAAPRPIAAAEAGGGAPPQDEKRLEVRVTPEMKQHTRILDVLFFVGQAYGLAVLLLVLSTRLSKRMRDLSRKIAKRPFLTSFLFFAIFSVVTTLLEFPLTYYADFVVPHQFNLTDQSFASWLGDGAKALALSIVVGGLIAALALLGIRKVKRWWLALWLGSIPIMVLLVVIAPVFFEPIFNKFEPLKDPVLRQALLDEASRAGIEGSRVYQVNKSKQTKTMNAYVTGLGPTKRIVLWDTTLQKMTKDEILAVMAHEMGHYVLNHIWKGLAFGVLVSLVVCFLGQKAYDAGVRRWGPKWGFEERGDPAALPWLLVVVSIIGFFLMPVTNGFSRRIEHQSDVFGLELTHMNEPMATAFVKLAEDSKVEPNPGRLKEFWRYSHPSIARRIEFVLRYKPWEQGQPNQLWHPGAH